MPIYFYPAEARDQVETHWRTAFVDMPSTVSQLRFLDNELGFGVDTICQDEAAYDAVESTHESLVAELNG